MDVSRMSCMGIVVRRAKTTSYEEVRGGRMKGERGVRRGEGVSTGDAPLTVKNELKIGRASGSQ